MGARRVLRELSGALRRGITWGELYHKPQALGLRFRPADLNGYFNDLTGKTRYRGPADEQGIPLLAGPDGRLFYYPTMTCQKALGHYDSWLVTGDRRHLREFISASRWLVQTQDPHGGWPCFRPTASPLPTRHPIGLPFPRRDAISPYSGMAQGQAISVLVRAFALSRERTYRDAAELAFALLGEDVSRGGVCASAGHLVSIEEAPMRPRNTILNGWVFGLFGVWDYWLSTQEQDARSFLERNVESLLDRLDTFDLGWWSLYDEAGHIAKPFYHDLHVSQLIGLSAICPSHHLQARIQRWGQAAYSAVRGKALLAYAFQWQSQLVLGRLMPIRGSGHA